MESLKTGGPGAVPPERPQARRMGQSMGTGQKGRPQAERMKQPIGAEELANMVWCVGKGNPVLIRHFPTCPKTPVLLNTKVVIGQVRNLAINTPHNEKPGQTNPSGKNVSVLTPTQNDLPSVKEITPNLLDKINDKTKERLDSVVQNLIEDYDPNLLTILKTDNVAQEEFEKINAGKAKEIWVPSINPDNIAYLTPVQEEGIFNKIMYDREREIREEVETAQAITKELNLKGGSTENLNVDLEESDIKINNLYTIKTKKADGDLEGKIRGPDRLTFPGNMKLGSGFLNGMKNLHATNRIHGDLKPENILIFGDRAAISDFGKTRVVNGNEDVLQEGNPRFACPSGRNGKQQEVYSAALILLRIHEEELFPPVIKPPKPAPDAEKTVDTPEPKKVVIRRGVEKFLIENKNCPQSENSGIKGRVKFFARTATVAVRPEINSQTAKNELHNYITGITDQLKLNHPGQEVEIEQLGNLLKAMTEANPGGRPSMEKASDDYARIMASIQKKPG